MSSISSRPMLTGRSRRHPANCCCRGSIGCGRAGRVIAGSWSRHIGQVLNNFNWLMKFARRQPASMPKPGIAPAPGQVFFARS